MKGFSADTTYRVFSELLNSYRLFCVVSEALRSGIIDLVEGKKYTIEELLGETSLQAAEGRRFVDLLITAGLLELGEGVLGLSSFSKAYLSRTSVSSQRHLLEFEPLLQDNWRRLGTVLQEGQGTLLREQPAEECRQRLELFQQAMGDAARVRSRELWNALPHLPEQGTIIDIGAGDGTYLREFLERHPRWQGVACDLPDVCSLAAAGTTQHKLRFHPCNILDRQELAAMVARYRATADVLLLSNICHCYSPEENGALLREAGKLVATGGQLIVHDFFRDTNMCGALYDLHMLVNTWNGRAYTVAETVAMLLDAGFGHNVVIELPSCSHVMVSTHVLPTVCGAQLQASRRLSDLE